MTTQEPAFREELYELLLRFGMPKTATGFTLTCENHNAPILLNCTFAPEFEGERPLDESTKSLMMAPGGSFRAGDPLSR